MERMIIMLFRILAIGKFICYEDSIMDKTQTIELCVMEVGLLEATELFFKQYGKPIQIECFKISCYDPLVDL